MKPMKFFNSITVCIIKKHPKNDACKIYPVLKIRNIFIFICRAGEIKLDRVARSKHRIPVDADGSGAKKIFCKTVIWHIFCVNSAFDYYIEAT